ncbi:hypothetical protein PGT21_006494 [Puccinia graminis f. sp. tritici]|uniref:Uncharacterized protein n=1 Tax=Puccinia graminis f. sp. tritici TaxID=56615 RepID=A0A5B0SCL2_PUCGR|nr:hypothetical protein PGT21_006494 [Puccinia graminis f. sp. tritici]KAA1135540.1 hypothetical protein PGTUg99_016130 [Puccinia graminis f. sp. tritici]
MKITYLSGCLMLIVTILGSGNVSGTESCVKSRVYQPTECAKHGCTTRVKDGQYTYRCSDPYCRNTDCGTKWYSTGKICYTCQVKATASASSQEQ